MFTRTTRIGEDHFARLLLNGHATAGGDEIDPEPVVKLFTPDAGATWLLTEVDPDDEDRAFGLCDLGLGYPEFGWVRFSELESLRGRLGLALEVDEHFEAKEPISVLAARARHSGRIETS